jgi:hypothetical protein
MARNAIISRLINNDHNIVDCLYFTNHGSQVCHSALNTIYTFIQTCKNTKKSTSSQNVSLQLMRLTSMRVFGALKMG